MTAFLPKRLRMESKAASSFFCFSEDTRGATFLPLEDGEAGEKDDAGCFPGLEKEEAELSKEPASSRGEVKGLKSAKSKRLNCTGSSCLLNFEVRTPKSRIGSPFHSSSNSSQAL